METASPSRNHYSWSVLSILCSLYSSVFLIPSACAASFAGGTGEPNDPYQIATAEHLVSIGSDPNLLSRHFVLVADIDLDPNLPGGRVFTQAVICPDYRQSFTGCLDGRGHVIRNLVIQGQGDLGLIRKIAEGGVVQDLHLDNVRITGSWSVGGLAGSNDGAITSCSSTGSVTGQGIMIGGLVGENQGTIRESHTAGDIRGMWYVGGLVGWNRTGGILSSCHSTGDVTGNGDVGGLVGRGYDSLSVCYATGHVTGQYSVGGLVGSLMGNFTLTFCYSTGNVTGNDHVGGLVGVNYSGNILYSFSTGNVIGSNWDVGGLVGHQGGGTISSSYSTGSVSGSSSTQHIGGLAGVSSATVSYCYSIGPVTGGNGVGGAVRDEYGPPIF